MCFRKWNLLFQKNRYLAAGSGAAHYRDPLFIGTITQYEEHPIIRFNSRKLKATEKGNNLSVSINTDDQGVFDTLLENEYGLMALALKKATDENMNALYDIEDIYEWIDYVRRMGLDQVFS